MITVIAFLAFSQSANSKGKIFKIEGVYENAKAQTQRLIENEDRAGRESAERLNTIRDESQCQNNCYQVASQESDRIYVECLTGAKKGQKETVWVRGSGCYSLGSVLFDSCDKNFDYVARQVCLLYSR
jgi:hypothetical protein